MIAFRGIGWSLVAGLMLLVGCAPESTPVPGGPEPAVPAPGASAPAPTPTPDEKKAEGKADEKKADAGGASGFSTEELAEINTMPEPEKGKALAQKVCLVSGEHLGSMGVPVTVTFEGQVGFLCCKGCMKEFNADPKKAFASLKK